MTETDAIEKRFVFEHRGLQFAVPVMDVLEIVEVDSLRPFQGQWSSCLGNMAHRRNLLPVFDAMTLGTNSARSDSPPALVVVLQHGGALFALTLEKFVGVVDFPAGQPPAGADTTGSLSVDVAGQPAVAANACVTSVQAFRDNALVTLSLDTIADLVKRSFGDQRIISEDGDAGEDEDGAAASDVDQRILLCASLGHLLLAAPVLQVLEVIEGCDVTPLFRVDPCLRGLINLRGSVLACVDLSETVGLDPRLLQEHDQFIVLSHDEAQLALCVDHVTGIRTAASSDVQRVEGVLHGEMTHYLAGVIEEADDTLFLLDVDSILNSPRLAPYMMRES